MTQIPSIQLQLRSLVREPGVLELSLVEVPVEAPRAAEVVVRIEAAPLNPSDLGLLFGAADMSTATASGGPARPVVSARIAPAAMRGMAARLGQSLPVGNEGAGVVVAAGESGAARALLGRKVALLGGALYSHYRTVNVEQCLLLPEDVTSAQGAAAFINPMTALGMIETMRHEGHRALVHTAAASNLGRMLLRLCARESIPLVNIVRGESQAALLRDMGARYTCNSASADFTLELAAAVRDTGATLAFDAIGGGPLAGQILDAMEAAASADMKVYSRYGSTVHKQVYLYGGLDSRPTEFSRTFGMSWGIGGWLVMHFMQRIGPEAVAVLKQRIVAEIKTTFASEYSQEISLAKVLDLAMIGRYGVRATGQKFLINPSRAD